ncbi:hypothetical protein Acr_06g0011880 [Actinidia rufa]|uniref:CCHC-type domain-containing protein n=1 Tax=Actinidia rufa TaxID=165716 RepID=A0A7J0ERZ6_9ERIC|nr:hypothetical protein Acr_06g0011880 [Actinidia rufa]
MTGDKEVSAQIHKFQLAALQLKNEGMDLLEPFVAAALIEKLLNSWRDYKNGIKHKPKNMNLEDVIVHVRVEDKNRQLVKAKELVAKANIVEDISRELKPKGGVGKPKFRQQQYAPYKPHRQKIEEKNGNCHVCGKSGHQDHQCKHGKDNDKSAKPSVNLVEANIVDAVVVSEVNTVSSEKDWVVDSGATWQICDNRSAFASYVPMGVGEEQVLMVDSKPAPVVGKGKAMLKVTSRKVLSLHDVLHVMKIRSNLVCVSLLIKLSVKIPYCNKGLFVLKCH